MSKIKRDLEKFRKKLIVVILLGLILLFFIISMIVYRFKPVTSNSPAQEENSDIDVNINADSTTTKIEPNNQPTTQKSIADKALISVPFAVQAPDANWDELHEEACEEASLIMIKHFVSGTKIGSSDSANQEIIDLTNYENANGYKIDVTVEQLSEIAKGYYGIITGRVKREATIDDIKKELTAGRPVIVPAAGKILPNPNFRGEGPLYHMLVVKGYDKNGFITNDPGTKKGEGFRYSFNNLYNAIHNWNENDIMSGEKTYLVFDQ